MQVFVPARYIKDATIDDRAETLNCIGVGLTLKARWGRKIKVPPVTFGVMTVLEALECRFIPAPLECDADDILTALAVTISGPQAVMYLDDPSRLHRDVMGLRFWLRSTLPGQMPAIIRHYHETPFTGFGMIKKKTPSAEKWWFGAVNLAALIQGIGQHTGYRVHDIQWRLPLVLAGHIVAALVAGMDEFAVGRPKNEGDVKAQITAAIARERAGELHPWQKDLPEDYPLSETQKAARTELVEEFEASLKSRSME